MSAVMAELWPYLVLMLVGFLPNEIWRVLGLVLARGLDEDSEIVVWLRAVATAILAGVIAKLILFSPGALATIPLSVRVGAAVVRLSRLPGRAKRSVFAGVLAGEAVLLLGGLSVRALDDQPVGDGGGELHGMLGQHVRLFLLARRRLHRHAGLARDDVDDAGGTPPVRRRPR